MPPTYRGVPAAEVADTLESFAEYLLALPVGTTNHKHLMEWFAPKGAIAEARAAATRQELGAAVQKTGWDCAVVFPALAAMTYDPQLGNFAQKLYEDMSKFDAFGAVVAAAHTPQNAEIDDFLKRQGTLQVRLVADTVADANTSIAEIKANLLSGGFTTPRDYKAIKAETGNPGYFSVYPVAPTMLTVLESMPGFAVQNFNQLPPEKKAPPCMMELTLIIPGLTDSRQDIEAAKTRVYDALEKEGLMMGSDYNGLGYSGADHLIIYKATADVKKCLEDQIPGIQVIEGRQRPPKPKHPGGPKP